MIDHEQIVSFMLRLKYSLNIQKPESLTCENIKLPAPKDKTIKFGFAPVCVTKGITTPAAVNAATVADPTHKRITAALGKDVFHYHLHVVYVPVVEKQILWSKRCKDEALRGTVKETIMQVSRSKKWLSKPAVDKDGKPILQVNGKPVLRKSYSVLQDDFFQHTTIGREKF